jgi:hypothetical protein
LIILVLYEILLSSFWLFRIILFSWREGLLCFQDSLDSELELELELELKMDLESEEEEDDEEEEEVEEEEEEKDDDELFSD